ncbi:hypothetical protein HYS91_00385 [Candidatus Daviesbacteria bacterium]|nr:hypothetical protein [Candidatus Daviesbacteria bacterium]
MRGFAHLGLLILLLIGIIAGVYLVTSGNLNFLPIAKNGEIKFVDYNNPSQEITSTYIPRVKVRLSAPWPFKTISSPIKDVTTVKITLAEDPKFSRNTKSLESPFDLTNKGQLIVDYSFSEATTSTKTNTKKTKKEEKPKGEKKVLYAKFESSNNKSKVKNATIKLLPAPDSIANLLLSTTAADLLPDEEFSVNLLARSDQAEANLFVAKLNFSKEFAEVTSIETSDSFISPSFFTEKKFDNSEGTISLVGGVPAPGYKTQGEDKVMAKINFKAKNNGLFDLQFASDSAIYRNLDNKNILDLKNGIKIPIGGVTVSPSPQSSDTESSTSPTPSSSPGEGGSTDGSTKGDGNGDGKIDLEDLSILLTYFGSSDLDENIINLDINNDGKINTFDYSGLVALLKSSGVIS